MEEAGLDAVPVVWSDPAADWSTFDLVVASGAWDNIHRVEAFLDWIAMVADELGVPMVNSPETLRWNLDKRYLRELEADGVPIVPTRWVGPDDDDDLTGFERLAAELVVKPNISGGGFQTARYEAHERAAARAHVAALGAAGRTAMVQPYQCAVDDDGEVGLVFLGGRFSHAVHKDPMIRRGAGPRDSLIENQVVTAATATPAQLALGRQAVDAAEARHGPTTYARVDAVPGPDGTSLLLELELLDPVLFLTTDPPSAARLAGVVAASVPGVARPGGT
jgi:glutathione synthase/RimK-type ligase-like ATP-grasp enzyme